MDDYHEYFDELDDYVYNIPLGKLLRDNLAIVRDKGTQFRTTCPNVEGHSGGVDKHPSFFVRKSDAYGYCQTCKHQEPNMYAYYGERPAINKDGSSLTEALETKEEVPLALPEDAILDKKYPMSRGISKAALFDETFFISETLDEANYDDETRSYAVYKDMKGEIRWIEGRKTTYNNDEADRNKSIKGSKKFIYPANVELEYNTVVVVEGIYDLLTLRENGIYNVVMAGGTGAKAKDILDIPHLKRVVIAYDGDDSGREHAQKLMNTLKWWVRKHNINIIVDNIDIPEGKDPGSMNKEEIKECIQSYL